MVEVHDALRVHLAAFFRGHEVDCLPGVDGPIGERIPGFRIFRVAPGPRFEGWAYVSSGCATVTATDGHGLEFVLTAPVDDRENLETLTVTAFYHAGPPAQRLDHGHVVPIGRPWLGKATCDRFLISLPYPFGPGFEACSWDGGHARLLWLLPITEAEQRLARSAGLEALEARLDEAGIDYLDLTRPSVI